MGNWAEGVPSKTTDFPAKTEDWRNCRRRPRTRNRNRSHSSQMRRSSTPRTTGQKASHPRPPTFRPRPRTGINPPPLPLLVENGLNKPLTTGVRPATRIGPLRKTQIGHKIQVSSTQFGAVTNTLLLRYILNTFAHL